MKTITDFVTRMRASNLPDWLRESVPGVDARYQSLALCRFTVHGLLCRKGHKHYREAFNAQPNHTCASAPSFIT